MHYDKNNGEKATATSYTAEGEDYDLQAWVDSELAAGKTAEEIATHIDEKVAKKETMIEELKAKAEELRSGANGEAVEGEAEAS